MSDRVKQNENLNSRIFDIQQTLSEHLNIPLRIIYSNCIERLYKYCEEYFGLNLADQFVKFIANRPEATDLYEKIPIQILEALWPTDKQKELAANDAIWMTPKSGENGFHEELKSLVPPFKHEYLLNILRKCREISDDPLDSEEVKTYKAEDGTNLFLIKISLKGMSTSFPSGILVLGPVWAITELRTELPETKSKFADDPVHLTLEQNIHNCIEQFVKRFGDRYNFDLGQKTNLLLFSSASHSFTETYINQKAEIAKHVFIQISNLYENNKENFIGLSSEEWLRCVLWIVFWLSEKSHLLYKVCIERSEASSMSAVQQVLRLIWKIFRAQTIALSTPLTCRNRDQSQILITINCTSILKSQKIPITFEITREETAVKPHEIFMHNNLQTFNIQPLAFYYKNFIENCRTSRARQVQISFERNRQNLQDMLFNDRNGREQLMVRSVQHLVRADAAFILRYNSLEDVLELGNISLSSSIRQALRYEDILQIRTRASEILKKNAEPHKRKNSWVYKCLDEISIQSRFRSTKQTSPFAAEVLESIEDEIIGPSLGLSAGDLMILPLKLHGRVLGVLCVGSTNTKAFRYSDRIYLQFLAQRFEVELFQADLLTSLERVNKLIDKRTTKSWLRESLHNVYNQLTEEIAKLLAVSGVSLWWRKRDHVKSWEIIGIGGKKIVSALDMLSREFKDDARDAITFISSLEDLHNRTEKTTHMKDRTLDGQAAEPEMTPIVYKLSPVNLRCSVDAELLRHGLHGCVALPIHRKRTTVFGYLILHHKSTINITREFENYLRYITSHLSQIMGNLAAQEESFENIQNLIVHEVNSALKVIDDRTTKISKVPYQLGSTELDLQNHGPWISDIKTKISDARKLLDWLSNPDMEKSTLKYDSGMDAYFHQLNTEPMVAPTDLWRVVFEAHESRQEELKYRSIRLDPIFPEDRVKLWVRKEILSHVFTNFIDNIVKYGSRGKSFAITEEKGEVFYSVVLKSMGMRLESRYEANPDVIFEKGVRGATQEILSTTDGRGVGLYMTKLLATSWGGDILLTYRPEMEFAFYEFVIVFPNRLLRDQKPWGL